MLKQSRNAVSDRKWRQHHRWKSHYCNYRSEARRFAKFAKQEDLKHFITYYVAQYQKRFLS